jgi:hypothetical protein
VSISERIAVAKPIKGCKACAVIASLPDGDRDVVVAEFTKPASERISMQKLSEILTSEGYPIHRHTLASHSRVCV